MGSTFFPKVERNREDDKVIASRSATYGLFFCDLSRISRENDKVQASVE